MKYLDALIIGAGFSGLYQLHCLRDKLKLNTLVLEEGDDLEVHGIGIDTQEPDATQRVLLMVLLFQKKFLKTGLGKKDIQNKT